MKINNRCYACILARQIKRAEKEFDDPVLRKRYTDSVKDLLDHRAEDDTTPYMNMRFDEILRSLGGTIPSFAAINREYNAFALSMESDIEAAIEASPDPLRCALLYARVGNYIDFGAVKNVSKEQFLSLVKKAETEVLPQETWDKFVSDLTQAKTFLLLHDNCGEIVFDKLFVRQLKKAFPGLAITCMVRGGEALNDATVADAIQTGLDREAAVITNGQPIGGTVLRLMPEESRKVFDTADVILAKGQANYEALNGSPQNIYYAFLCKCELFTERFGVKQFEGMFIQ